MSLETTSLQLPRPAPRDVEATNSGFVLSFLRGLRPGRHHPLLLLSAGLTVRVQGPDQSGVNGKLSASEEWESVHHHFKSPGVTGELHQVQIAHHHVGWHPACFPADAGCHTLECVTSPLQDPSPSTGCSVVGTRIEWEATLATVQGPGKRKVKTTQEEDAEHVWLYLCDPACWAGGEHQSCTRASLRQQMCLARIRKPQEEIVLCTLFNPARRFMLPATSYCSRLKILWLVLGMSGSACEGCP